MPIANAFESRLLGDVLEGSIGLLVVHAIPILRAGFLRNRTLGRGIGVGCAVDQVKIEPAIVVAIEKRRAGAHGLNQIFARGVRRLVQKMHARLLGDIDKPAGNLAVRLGSRGLRGCQCDRKRAQTEGSEYQERETQERQSP